MVTRSTHTVFPMTLLMLTWTSSRDRFTAYNTSVCHAADFLSVPDLVDECRGNGGWLLRRLSLGLGVIPLAMVTESGVPCMASVGDWGTDIPIKHWKWFNTSETDKLSPVKRICVFEHSVMTNFNCACPAIQRGQGSGFLSEGSSWLTACMSEQRRFWRDCADAQARLNLRCSHRR